MKNTKKKTIDLIKRGKKPNNQNQCLDIKVGTLLCLANFIIINGDMSPKKRNLIHRNTKFSGKSFRTIFCDWYFQSLKFFMGQVWNYDRNNHRNSNKIHIIFSNFYHNYICVVILTDIVYLSHFPFSVEKSYK